LQSRNPTFGAEKTLDYVGTNWANPTNIV
jgi:hypothetical protein